MVAHFIHYVSRNVRLRAPVGLGTTPPSSDAFEMPLAHLTHSQNGTVRQIRENDVIWLVSQLKSPWGSLPPGIDARIEVQSIECGPSYIRIVASPRSGWVPLRDATVLLSNSMVHIAAGGETLLWKDSTQPVGIYLQSMRRLANGAEFERWHARGLESAVEFVSYRQRDGTADAFRHVAKRLAFGKSIFWDRWSLPRGVAERREISSPVLLDRHLERAIDHARVVWGIASAGYGEQGSYSAYEKCYAGSRLLMIGNT